MGYNYGGTYTNLGYGRGWMNQPAANSQWRMDRALGHPQQITEAGRTWDEQNAHYQNYLRNGYPIALSPDAPSLHQMGNAKDTDERPVALHNDHGWYQTVYRWVNGVWTLVEPWHFEYFYDRDNHRNEPAGGEEDDMTPEQDALLKNIAAHLYLGGPSARDPKYTGGVGTVYELLKAPVQRMVDGQVMNISQIQDNADTNTMVRVLLEQNKALVEAIEKLVGEDGGEVEPPKP